MDVDVTELSPEQAQREKSLVMAALNEIIGIFMMMFMGCLGCYDEFNIGPVIPAFAFAFAILIALQSVGGLGACHINPAVTLSMVIIGEMNLKEFAVYVTAQYIGSFLGYGALWLTVPRHSGLCLLTVKMVTPIQAFFLEAIGTAFLISAVCGAGVEREYRQLHDAKYLRLIFAICGIVFGLVPFTGAGINPARALPPAVFYNDWTDHWLYQVAPLAGSATASLVYRFMLDPEEKYSLHNFFSRKKW